MKEFSSISILRKYPVSPRKMRRYADSIRLCSVMDALQILKFQCSPTTRAIEKLLLSALSNWQVKYQDYALEDADLVVKEVRVDVAPMLKRVRPAPRGRAHRIRKRSSHMTLRIVNRGDIVAKKVVEEAEVVKGQEKQSALSEKKEATANKNVTEAAKPTPAKE